MIWMPVGPCCYPCTMEIEPFFAALGSRLAEARYAERKKYERFFHELAPRLETTKQLDLNLDRLLARRFNVFDYLRTDELGLSRVIADFLDPVAAHGQGRLFLDLLLERLKQRFPQSSLEFEAARVSVTTEWILPSSRRIDVLVEFTDVDGNLGCLAIENKPYAEDQEKQVKDYLKFLGGKYSKRFLLLYLSRTGDGPSERSIESKDLDSKWKDRFAILPYHEDRAERSDAFDAFRITYSIVEWLRECRKGCEVDRLRWFLHDAELFCQRTFGDRTMTTDCESKTVRDFLLSNPGNLRTALAVYESWPAIRNEVCERFLKRLCSLIKQKMKKEMTDVTNGMHVDYKYGGEARNPNFLWLYREGWRKCGEDPWDIRHTAIVLLDEEKKANTWSIGIRDPYDSHGDTLRESLNEVLGRGKRADGWYPWWDWMDTEKGKWSLLVPNLQEECGMPEGGEITNYFVERFTEVARAALPVIDAFEGNRSRFA